MIEFMLQALVDMMTPAHLFFLTLGTVLGLVVGILPGLGGIAGLSLLLPFVFGMDESHALSMMIGLLAPTVTSDTFPSVLMGIPGTAGSQATVVDGFPLSKKGEGARALGAAFTASLFGGVFGAVVLTGAVFAARPIILAMGFGEQLLLIVLALSMIGMLTGQSALKGLATCAVGLLLGSVGAAPATGEFRMTMDSIYLSDGIPIVVVGLGMFAMPEIIDLLRRSHAISETGKLGTGWLQGFKDAIRHKFIVIRCSVIGCLVGALPGLGGSVVDWIAYGHVVQTSRDRENFGHGDIRGVLAPESANNAKEGGALIPTLLFGIPGSGSMAILLGGFVLVGVEPGITMVTEHLNLTFMMIWSLALANIIGALLCLALANQVARITTIRYALLAPFMLMLIFFAAFQATRDWGDLIALFVMGVLGVFMRRFGWSRPALLIGYFLAPRLEPKIYQAAQVYGWSFFERPIVIVLVLLTLASIYSAWRFSPNAGKVYERGGISDTRNKAPQLLFALLMVAFAAFALIDSFNYQGFGQIFPMVVSIVSLLLLLPLVAAIALARQPAAWLHDAELGEPTVHSDYYFIAWIVGMLALVALVGFPIGCALFIILFTSRHADGWRLRNVVLGLAGVSFLGLMSHFLTLRYPAGLLQDFIEMPWWLGG
ncbi:MAG: tripartite tricarboxylate transporter permease [Gammaproteobacteria bacterium]|nr:tripartite tricarboxylate transporter permease [Gammaproteobacteria bacterium]